MLCFVDRCLSIFFWLPLWYLLAILLSVHLQFTALITCWYLLAIAFLSIFDLPLDHPFCIFWPLYFLSIFNWPFWLPLCYHFGHSVVCPSSIYHFDYPFGFFWPICCLSIFDLPFWLPLWYLLVIVLSVHLQCTALITPLVSFSHCIVCPSSIYRLITPLVSFGHSSVWPSSIYVLITTLVSSNFSSYARACSLYSKCLQRHHILSNKLLNWWFFKNRFIFQNVLEKISTPCWKAFCQLCTGDENGIVNYILI